MMGCECYYDERPAFYVSRMRTARKIHRCYECARAILPGERYENVAAKWDGRVDDIKTCQRCLDLRNYTTSNIPCVCWSHGNMIEDCIESLREYKRELPGLLFGAYRRKIIIEKAEFYKNLGQHLGQTIKKA
jgi:hypothetical protein